MNNEIQIRNVDDLDRIASMCANSRLFGVSNVEEAAVKIMYGTEMGLPVLQALMGINVIKGKPVMSANLIAALIKRSGKYDYIVKVWDSNSCVISWTQYGKHIGDSFFTMEDAHRANLVKPDSGWVKFPNAMLFARALTQGGRTYCADVFVAPIYTPDELDANAQSITQDDIDEAGVIITPVSKTRDDMIPPSFKDVLLNASGDPEKRKSFVKVVYDGLNLDGTIDPFEQFKVVDRLIKSGEVKPARCSSIIRDHVSRTIGEAQAESASDSSSDDVIDVIGTPAGESASGEREPGEDG